MSHAIGVMSTSVNVVTLIIGVMSYMKKCLVLCHKKVNGVTHIIGYVFNHKCEPCHKYTIGVMSDTKCVWRLTPMSQTTGVVCLRKMSEYSHITMRVTQNTQVWYVRVKCERFHRNLGVISYIMVDVTSQLRIWLPSHTMCVILHNLWDVTVYPIVSTLMLCDAPKWGWCPT